jgi:ribonuclease BN (tRNA processing enzyme)
MNLTVLGSNAGCPAPSNPGSGYLVESGNTTIWMDCGPGTFAELARRMEPSELDAVILSHTHVDHSTDLLGLFAYLAYGLGGSVTIPVYAPAGTRDHLAAYARAGDDHPFHRVLDFREVGSGDTATVSPIEVRFGEAVHPVPALVTRLDQESTAITYSGDTGPGGDLIETAWNTDMLVCEAAIQGSRGASTYPHHLTAFEAGEIASMTGASLLVLTHIPFDKDPQLSIDQAAGAFVGSIEYAATGTTFSTE